MYLQTTLMQSPPAIKFALVGGSGFIVDFAVLYILFDVFDLDLMLARMLAFGVAASSNWIFNRLFTFRDKTLAHRKTAEWLRFLASAVLSAIPNIGTFYLLTLFFPATWGYLIFAMVCGILIGYYSNYRLASGWVYRPQT